MSRLALVERTKLNLSEATVVLGGGSALETEVLVRIFSGFGVLHLKRAEDVAQLRSLLGPGVDLLVVDAMMGMGPATEIVRELRSCDHPGRFAPVVLVAASPSPSMIRAGRDSGVNYLVAKPLTPQVLFERLVWIVRERRKHVDSANYLGPDRRARAGGPPEGVADRRVNCTESSTGDAP